MQYILSEAEYQELKRDQATRLRVKQEKLQSICTLAAQHIPVAHDWSHDKTPRPWGCILGPDEQNPGYCDDCPVSDLCPHPGKEWSK